MKTIVIAAAAVLSMVAGVASADQALAQKSACMSCHQVAKKYKGDAKAADHIVGVIKKGGKGVWGPVPMPPHPQVSDENAKKLADWVLSL